jgi:hypothetical protein
MKLGQIASSAATASLAGEQNSRRLQPGGTGRQVAARMMVKAKASIRQSQPFNRPLRYLKIGLLAPRKKFAQVFL